MPEIKKNFIAIEERNNQMDLTEKGEKNLR